jgi:hypothetical protein
MLGNSWVAKQLAAFQEGLSSTELLSGLWKHEIGLNSHTVAVLYEMLQQFTCLHERGSLKKVKLSQQQAVEAHRVVRRRGSHIFWTISS